LVWLQAVEQGDGVNILQVVDFQNIFVKHYDLVLGLVINLPGFIGLDSLGNLDDQGECGIAIDAFGDLSQLVLLDLFLVFGILLNDVLLGLGLVSEILLDDIGCVSEDDKQDKVDQSEPCLGWSH
jgi:hypothetical protein